MTINWSGLQHIVGGDGLVGAAKEDIGRELAAYNGDIRGQMHAYHAQHAFFTYSLSKAICETNRTPKTLEASPENTMAAATPQSGRRIPGGSAIYMALTLASLDAPPNSEIQKP